MTALLQEIFGLLLHSAVLLLFALLTLRLTRRRGPAVQSLVGRAALAGVALLLLTTPLTGRLPALWRVTLPSAPMIAPAVPVEEPTPVQAPTLPKREGEQEGIRPVPFSGRSLEEAEKSNDILPASPPVLHWQPRRAGGPLRSDFARSKAVGSSHVYPTLAALWGLGTTALFLWLGVCQWHLTHLRRTGRTITAGPAYETLAALTPRPPRLLSHPSVLSPFLAGIRNAAIFLPDVYETEFDPTALRAILAHELAHLARRDTAWTLASRLLSALLWPQPLLWLLCRRLEQISEEACDEVVLARDCSPRDYADCLLTLAERHPLGRRERALGAGVTPFRSSLGRRIGRILDKGTHAMSTISLHLRLGIAAGAVAATLSGALLISAAPAQVSQPAPTRIDAPTLVGVWTGKPAPNAKYNYTLIFGPKGNLAVVAERGSRREYGRYTADSSTVTTTLPHIQDNGHTVVNQVAPKSSTVTYSIVNGVLTLQPKTGPVETVHRIGTYPDGLDIEAVAAQQAALLKSAPPTSVQTPLGEARFLAGLTAVQGPGVVVTLRDSKKRLPNMPSGMTPPNLIHDTDINQVVNELKAAGAEAIAVNDQRLVATSAIRTAGPIILINFIPTVPPYVIKAIGDPKTLASAMNLPGGVASQLKVYDPAMFSVRQAAKLMLPANSWGSMPRYAKPVSDGRKIGGQATRISQMDLAELKAESSHLEGEAADLDGKMAALEQEDEWNRSQQAALGKSSRTIAALQAIDKQSALFQLEILLNTQGAQTALRRTETRAAQQELRTLTARRAQVAHTLPPVQERTFEAKSRAYERRQFAVGIEQARVQVAAAANWWQLTLVQERLETLGAKPVVQRAA